MLYSQIGLYRGKNLLKKKKSSDGETDSVQSLQESYKERERTTLVISFATLHLRISMCLVLPGAVFC